MACAAVLTACVLPAPGVAGGAPATYRDPAGDAGKAPDLAAVTMTEVDAGTLAVSITLAEPTELGRSGWILMGIDTDRNPHSGGMHGSEAIVLANGERAVLLRRIGGHFRPTEHPIDARLTGDQLAFTLELADLRVRTFDFAVATLRQNADMAPDRGVFAYPAGPSAGG
jgi:hypothetical protein